MEEWRNVIGYEGVYAVSSFGRVKRTMPGRSTKPGKILKPRTGTRGRKHVALTFNSKAQSLEVHRLVAEAFLGPRPAGKQINHIDYKPLNNRADNLEYISPSENVRHAYRHGFVGGRGEKQWKAKLTSRDIPLIRNSPLGPTALALHYNVTRSTIKKVRNRSTWKHIP